MGVWGPRPQRGPGAEPLAFLTARLFRRAPGAVWTDSRPIREELFGTDRLQLHARSLAHAQAILPGEVDGHPLSRRLDENGAALRDAFVRLKRSVDDQHGITPSAEWLIDNYYLVEQQIDDLRLDLPRGFYRQLPKLAAGPFALYPRVFGIAWAFVAHTDSGFDPALLLAFIAAYQEVAPLTIAELWAVSITLRLVLIENLRRLADQMLRDRLDRQRADAISDRLLETGGKAAASLYALAPTGGQALPDVFVVQLLYRLRDQDPGITPALAWIDRQAEAGNRGADVVVRDVHRAEGAVNVTTRNVITSLRAVTEADWRGLFERSSLVDAALSAAFAFQDMDFATRTLYRGAIEALARRSSRSELSVAEAAIAAARAAEAAPVIREEAAPEEAAPEEAGPEEAARQADPGYHLFGAGRRALEMQIGFRPDWPVRLQRLNRRLGVDFYALLMAATAAALLAAVLWLLAGLASPATLALLACLGIIPALDAAVPLINRLYGGRVPATVLPALELRAGIPPKLRTLLAVPTLLTTPAAVAEQVARLEVYYLASPPGALHFALLSDWTDAAHETRDDDGPLLQLATDAIARLNQAHGPAPGGLRFLLLHRHRVWSHAESCWMGWERKRGKLHELNQLLRGGTGTNFIAPPPVPASIRYVLTLDADTRLPRDTVRTLIGKMAHPLNRPRLDAAGTRVVEGYAILQPRMTAAMPLGRDGSMFQRLFSMLSGIDPYASAVSDIYQDVFGEGAYAGKGIYDVDAFEAALAGRVPDAAMLSHDLFEGQFARAALASDVELVEDFPARYEVAAERHHRWMRGDWQLLPWMVGRRAAGIPAPGRWRMRDNLRRSLAPPVTVAALLAGFTLAPRACAIWTGFLLATSVVPPLLPLLAALPRRRPDVTLASHLRARGRSLAVAATLSGLGIVFLAHQAWLAADAIARTLFRLAISRRRLLQWQPAAQVGLRRARRLPALYRWMVAGPAVAALALAAAFPHPLNWTVALPFAAVWALSPLVAWWISLPSQPHAPPRPDAADATLLRLTARRTWRFFERFVTEADSMLPPDNYQDDPAPVVAHRTSPTNIGLYLLSVAAAREFGWIGTENAVARLEATLGSMGQMARCRGHLFNWYGTTDRRPLDPRYVSTVDSGNLAGHLIAVANACETWMQHLPTPAARLGGATDAVLLFRQALAGPRRRQSDQPGLHQQLESISAGLLEALERARDHAGLPDWAALVAQAAGLPRLAEAASAPTDAPTDLAFWAEAITRTLADHHAEPALPPEKLRQRLATLAATARAEAWGMDFGFLFDPVRRLLSIGFLVSEAELDTNHYDLLASEARLASFLAIAKSDVPARHWFRLGRAATPVPGGGALISWSGSMFEYLMPSLVMRAPDQSLLATTNRHVVRRQIAYATGLGLPWGISEAALNVRDIELTYQYSNFGVPGLGLKRGLGENRVIAPYATALAAMVDAPAACANFRRLDQLGGAGRFGFYEALDFTPGRVPDGAAVAVVHNFMAHHQGMTILAICNTLFDGVMRARFHAEPRIQATELLMQERSPPEVSRARPWPTDAAPTRARIVAATGRRVFAHANQSPPATHLLSNGRFSTLLTAAGSGYSRWGDLAITRWREDATTDAMGSYVYVRDGRDGAVWSPGLQPCDAEGSERGIIFAEDRAEFTTTRGRLVTTMEVLVSAEEDAEVRRVSIRNGSLRVREIEVTSYAELVLAPQAADIAHPAFSKLFVQTEYLPDLGALIATRRRRAADDPEIWAAQVSVVEGDGAWLPEIETDRARFIGRGRDVHAPAAMQAGARLSGTVGTVLDPIFALRRRVTIKPGAIARVSFWTLVASSRAALLDLIDRHRDASAYTRAATLAWTQARVELHHLAIAAAEAAAFQQLACHVVYANPAFRPPSDAILRGAGPQSALWGQGISGDLPIVLLRIGDADHVGVVREMLLAHQYWRMKRLAVDLVILNERRSSYIQDLQASIETLARSTRSWPMPAGATVAGGVIVLRADLIPPETALLLSAVARVVLVAQRGSLHDQLDRMAARPAESPPRPARERAPPARVAAPPGMALEFFNGIGGFARGGREYVTLLAPGRATPMPWINVVANPHFGFQVSADGTGYTWATNSRENQITPWSNDPISDPPAEALYLRDTDSGAVWCPTASPIREAAGTYIARHGRGYSRFEYETDGLASDLLMFVPTDAPVKILRLRLTNRSQRPRRLSITAYVTWVLGPSRAACLPYIATAIDPATGAMFATNRWPEAFGGNVAFLDMQGQTEWTGDRREFIGRNGTLADPAAAGTRLSGRVGAGLDPCGAVRCSIDLPTDSGVEIVVLLGQAENAEAATALVKHYRTAPLQPIRDTVARQWDTLLDAVVVKTPDRAMDILLNGWLLYQALACRIWARAAFYQASGAYGFRDQLQDGMALAALRPDLTRAHLLRAAGRQFVEGDVQHWWLPHSGQGVRTRISDDRAWLAYATAQYVRVTNDAAVLDETLPFLQAPPLDPGAHDRFFFPETSPETASLYEHCARALDDSLKTGRHGLPLMGTGDWNDGMNRVGEGGEGESVWLGWLLHTALGEFGAIAAARNDHARVVAWSAHREALAAALEQNAWDGQWYRRAYFDDGTPLGSLTDDECRIDSIAQSWSVLSGAADPARARRAMDAVDQNLILPAEGLALLFTPPFAHTALEPGYIKGYPAGVRENGGQYSHAAMWSIMAFARLGDGSRAASLFALLNPINHARDAAGVQRYKVEPYVVAADVYSVAPHVGRGGWTWYTGSAAWMQRAGTESILGLTRRGDTLHIAPCIPPHWPGFSVVLRHKAATYRIDVRTGGRPASTIDGVAADVARDGVPLAAAGEHSVEVVIGG